VSTRVAVPRFFYKVLAAWVPDLVSDRPTALAQGPLTYHLETIGFIIPNAAPKGPYQDFAVTVDVVESRTGLDFFALLDDDIENQAEAVFDVKKW
jgi:endonuclease G